MIRVLHGDCRAVLATLEADNIDACWTDPPYGIGFMGKEWDGPAAFVQRRADKSNTWDHVGGNHNPVDSADQARTRLVEGVKYHGWCTEWARELYRVLKPGAYLMACGGTRTYHRLACAIEDAGFEIRDACSWLYGQGFPKSRDASKACSDLRCECEAIPASERQILCDRCGKPLIPDGFGTALKPAQELIVLARKPMVGNLAQNLMRHGTGAINVDACRVEGGERPARSNEVSRSGLTGTGGASTYGSFAVRGSIAIGTTGTGRWPANVQHDGSEEVVAMFPREAGAFAPVRRRNADKFRNTYGSFAGDVDEAASTFHGDSGSAARFFFSPKADAEARIYECTICQRKINANDRARHKHGQKNNAHIKSHPTVKPIDLIRYYLRLIVPPGGTVIDPFAGTGTTGEAAMLEGFGCLMIERDEGTVADIQHRIARWSGQDAPLFAEAAE
jgi:DNA modification methylase